jgi:hypothetical protein
MVSVLVHIARVRLTLAYAAALVAVAAASALAGPAGRDRLISEASTNLHNLGEGRVWTLVASAFVTGGSPIYQWLPGLVALLAVTELLWRHGRLAVAFWAGHLGATLLVAAGLLMALNADLISPSVATVSDVGMSYGALGALGALTAAISPLWRPAWAGWWLAVGVAAAALAGWDFTSVGHVLALLLGMGASFRFGSPAAWTLPLYGLFAVGSLFGYLVFVDADSSGLKAAGVGVVGALVADRLGRWRSFRRRGRFGSGATVAARRNAREKPGAHHL